MYNAIVEASSALDGIKLLDAIDSDHIEEVNALLAQIKPVVELTRSIELQRCVVPVRNDPDFFDYHMHDVQRLRNLSRALRFTADVAAFNFEYDDVTRYATVILDLANAVRRGGLVVDHLVSLAVAGCGIGCLRKVRERLPDHLRRELIETLLRYESEREPFSEIAERDAKWEIESGFEDKGVDFSEENFIDPKSEFPVDAQRVLLELVKSIGDQPESERQSMYHDQELHALAMTRLLTVDLAIRCWKERNLRHPCSIADLSPETLLKVPVDPFTGHDFIFRASKGAFTLYSTGPDKKDAGGKFGPWFAVSAGGYDLSLDSEDHWATCCAIPTDRENSHRFWSRLCFWRRKL